MKIDRLILYLLLVIIIGGAGCWISLGQYYYDPVKYEYRNFIANVGTFSISIAILAYADRILSKKQLDTTIALLIFVLMVFSVALSVVCVVIYFSYATLTSMLGLAISLVCWAMVNWNSPAFTDKADPFTPLGGEIPGRTSA